MGREELRAALEELTASLSRTDGFDDIDEVPAQDQSEDRIARLELLEELRGL